MDRQLFAAAAGAALCAVAATSGGRAAPAPGDSPEPPTGYAVIQRLREADAEFLWSAALSGKAQVEIGRIAAARSLREDVRGFAQHMVDDHGRVNQRLAELAAARDLSLPERLDARRQAEVDRLSRLSGAEFDRAYVTAMVGDHEADVREFQRQSTTGHDVDIQAFVNTTLLALEEHREMVHGLARDMETMARAPAVSD